MIASTTIFEILEKLNSSKDIDKIEKMISKFSTDYDAVAAKSLKFINYFGTYINERNFQEHIYNIIKISYDICENIDDLSDILLKNTVVNLIEIYITYSKLSGTVKESVLNILGAGFGSLVPFAQILNICLMVAPVFKDIEYIENREKNEEIEVTYSVVSNDTIIEIKNEIDVWIRALQIDLDKQDEMEENLIIKLKEITATKGFNHSSKEYKELEGQMIEMLRMQITSMALLFEIEDEDLTPVPIN